MGLFGKKKESGCCCGAAEAGTEAKKSRTGGACVKVLGGGCAKCNALEAATAEAMAELGMDGGIEHVTDYGDIAAYGVMSTPALVINGKVVSMGKVLRSDEVVAFLKTAAGETL